jgi:hypothetical protein
MQRLERHHEDGILAFRGPCGIMITIRMTLEKAEDIEGK